MKKLRDEHEAEILDLQNQLHESPDKIETIDENTLTKMKVELQNEHDIEIEDLRDFYEKKIKDMENRLKRELELLQSEHENEVNLHVSIMFPSRIKDRYQGFMSLHLQIHIINCEKGNTTLVSFFRWT